MKNIKIFAALLALGFAAVSCGDAFLDAYSKQTVSDGNFYKTIKDAEMALVGCYDGYQMVVSNGGRSFHITSEVMSDDCFGGTGVGDSRSYQVMDRFDQSQSPTHVDLYNDPWVYYYKAIFRCNTLLQKLDGIDFSSDEEARGRIEGETRGLRAVLYFDMVRMFERIPLLTEPTTDNVPQAPYKDTYDLIVSDLLFAAENIPVTAYPKSKAEENDGRFTTHAAKSLLARVYLYYTGYYGADDLEVSKSEVLQGLEEVIASREFELVPEFKSLWPASSYVPVYEDNTLDRDEFAGKGNSEIVFAQKFNNTHTYEGMGDGNLFVVMMGLRGTRFSPYGRGWGSCTVNPELYSAFSGIDKRRSASIIDFANETNESGATLESVFDRSDQREYTGYTTKKYAPTCLPDGTDDVGGENNFQISQDHDYYIIRYADVLLMAAELGSSNAQSYYDLVRERAGLASRPATFENIMEERRFEFAFEGIRYWDLMRRGVEYAANTIATNQTVLSGDTPETLEITAANIISKRGLCQIPSTQITLSGGVLTQNPGW